jgi:membrane protease YdiL (CAAX protease family)
MHSTELGTASRGSWLRTLGKRYQTELSALVRNRAVWCFAALFVVCAIYLLLTGKGASVADALTGTAPLVVGMGLLSIPLVPGTPPLPQAPHDAPRGQAGRLWAQVAVLGIVIVLTGQLGAAIHKVVPPSLATIPVWTSLVDGLTAAWGHVFHNPYWGAIPTLYVLIPGICLLALGARPAELGLARGYRVWAMALLWSLVFLMQIIIAVVAGHLALPALLLYAVNNLLQNGFSEEFLFRGALLTRLLPLVGASWAAVLSAVVFGLWHLGANTPGLAGDYLAGAALGVISQGTFGLGMAFVFLRTRNLVAPSIIHLLGDIPLG